MRRRRAFTMLELLLAGALAGMLMIGVLAVVASLALPKTAAGPLSAGEEETLREADLDAWVRLLRQDLGNADEIDISRPGEFTFVGYAAMEPAARARTHRPVRVTYGIEQIDGRSWLIRRQAALDVLTNRNVQRDLVCRGLTRLELAPTSRDPHPPAGNEAEGNRSARAGQKESATDSDADGVRPARPVDDPNRSVLFNGLYFYPRYLPERARKELQLPEPTLNDTGVEETATEKAPEGEATKTKDDWTPRTTVWRLRAWSGRSARPACDRLVKIQLDGDT